MRIAVLGAGAMGMLFGGYLSRENDVYLIDVDKKRVDAINEIGITVKEVDGSVNKFAPKALTSSEGMEPVDLIILFVKAMYSRSALGGNKNLVAPHTRVLTLQNGAGHEDILKEFVPEDQIIIGTTQHNSSISGNCEIAHGGGGKTNIGLLVGNLSDLEPIAENFKKCGFDTDVSDNIQKMIWEKIFLNVSGSALTAILRTKLGFMIDDEHAWNLTEKLVREAVAVANGNGLDFVADDVVKDIHKQLENVREGYTSIYADICAGRKTEVDTISGAVVRYSHKNGVPAPSHEFVVELIHAFEDRDRQA